MICRYVSAPQTFTCVMHKYDKIAYEMFSTSNYILLYSTLRLYGNILYLVLFLCIDMDNKLCSGCAPRYSSESHSLQLSVSLIIIFLSENSNKGLFTDIVLHR